VVDARVEPEFVKKEKARSPYVVVHSPHRVADVRGRDQVLSPGEAMPRDKRVEGIWNEADDNIGPADFFSDLGFIAQVQGHGLPVRAAGHEGLGLLDFDIGDDNRRPRTLQEIPDRWPGDKTRA
jgi:hypothetical protein